VGSAVAPRVRRVARLERSARWEPLVGLGLVIQALILAPDHSESLV
jgi:hypothetical protein